MGTEKRALVTGGAGFIGSHLVDLLVSSHIDTTIIDDLSSGKISNVKNHLDNGAAKIVVEDISNVTAFDSLTGHFDYIFHLAARADIVSSITNPGPYYSSNVIGTFNLLEFLRLKTKVKLVFAASSSCYGLSGNFPTNESSIIDPKYPYAHSKFLAESTIMHYESISEIQVISLRLFNVYGRRARTNNNYGAVLGVFLAQLLAKEPLTIVGDGNQLRDFVHVKDVARAFLMAAESSLNSEIINIGSGDPKSIDYLATLIGGDKQFIPWRPGEPLITHADIQKATQLLNWRPLIKFEDGIAEVLAHINEWKDAPLWNRTLIEKETLNWYKYLS